MLTLATTPEQEQALRAEAERVGQSIEQYAVQILARSVPPLQPRLSDEEFNAVWDEAQELFADIPFGTQELRTLKDEERALEEARHQRLFGRSEMS